jgi:hypothetical protein
LTHASWTNKSVLLLPTTPSSTRHTASGSPRVVTIDWICLMTPCGPAHKLLMTAIFL